MTTKETGKRLGVLSLLAVLVFLALIAQLINLQISHRQEFAQLAENNSIRLIPMMAPRGTFYDRNGEPLVASRAANTVSIVPMDLQEPETVISHLSQILGMSTEEIKQKIKEQTFRPFDPIRLKKDIGPDILAKIEEQKNDLPGVLLETVPIREYIYNDVGAHLFGYVGEINKEELDKLKDQDYEPGDIVGKIGLEKLYDNYLRGINGGEQVQVNASGKPIRTLGEKRPIPGNGLYLNIDTKVQQEAEKALDEAIAKTPGSKGGGVIAMDPRNGKIIALASRPSFDPNKFSTGISLKDWSELINNPRHPLNNRVIESAYPPGSIYKIVTAVAALEDKKVSPNDTFYCSGLYKWGFHCWKRSGHGTENLINGLRDSCNVVFYNLGERVGATRLAQYSKIFGLGEKTGIDLLGEVKGLLPSPEWKEKTYKQQWFPGETLNMSIGQGYHLYTPLQLAQMVSAAVNGGTVYKPYLVDKIVAPDGNIIKTFQPEVKSQIDISPITLNIVKQGLAKVISEGTGAGAFAGFPIPSGGKTGTAEAGVGKNDHAWFASFAPVDHPKLVVVVFVEEGGHGGATAAPVARKVYEAYFHLNKDAENSTKR